MQVSRLVFASMSAAAMVLGLAWTVSAQDGPDQQTNPLAGESRAVNRGRNLFEDRCQACHGAQATGGRAPALNTGEFRNGSSDSALYRFIRTGGNGMPSFSNLSPNETWQAISYLRSLSPTPISSAYDGPGGPANGERIFLSDCVACHQINAEGGIVAPDLTDAARFDAATLRAKILNPSISTRPRGGGPSHLHVTTKDGREYRGTQRAEDSFALEMTEIANQHRGFLKSELDSYETVPESLMPAYYAERLTDDEINDLVAFLKLQTGRDFAKTIQAEIPGGPSFARLANSEAEPRNWLNYWGSLEGTHYSSLDDINTDNVGLLQAKWARQIPGTSALESTPLVFDGIMYTSGQPGEVLALDARTGLRIWRYFREQPVRNPNEINPFNRGVAILGNRLFFGTLDAALVALDARTGKKLWEHQVADTMQGYNLTSAPLVVGDKIVTGVAGGEFGARGFVEAYDPVTGEPLWRTYTVPVEDEPGNETWKGDSWKHGGAPTWLTGSYDPELNLIYWATGNPGPDWDWKVREGDNLYSCSVLALDADTGEMRWYYQFTPNDSHDWDSTEDMVLVDREWHGEPRKLLLHADRNGFFYVLDRETGEMLQATPFVRQNWNQGFEDNGRPIVDPAAAASEEGAFVLPSVIGGTNFQAPSYSERTEWLYVEVIDFGQNYVLAPEKYEEGAQYLGGAAQSIPEEPPLGAIEAIDPETGEIMWKFPLAQMSFRAGVLATGGNVVFAGTAEGNMIALDATSGDLLWRFQTGAPIFASPMSYEAGGQQFVALSAGNVLYSFGLPE